MIRLGAHVNVYQGSNILSGFYLGKHRNHHMILSGRGYFFFGVDEVDVQETFAVQLSKREIRVDKRRAMRELQAALPTK